MDSAKNVNHSSAELAMMENYKIMGQIVAEMKEVAILPSEVPQDQSMLEKVEFPEEGGVLTYMQGHTHPFRGFPYFEFVDSIDKIKKIGKAQLSGLYHTIYKGNKLKLLSLLPAYWVLKKFFYIEVYMFYRLLDRFKLKQHRYCRAVRELNRCFNLEDNSLKMETWETKMMLRDLLAMVFEFDNAYRFRFQDLIEEFDKGLFKKNPIAELKRLVSIAIEREKTQELKDFWSLTRMLMNYLYLDPQIRKIVINVLSNIDIDQAKLTIEDKHYCKPRLDYNFGFTIRGEEVD